jgi:hypothetical protein
MGMNFLFLPYSSNLYSDQDASKVDFSNMSFYYQNLEEIIG